MRIKTDTRKQEKDVYLDTHVGCGGADESEWSANMNLLDDIPGVVWKSMKHLIMCETSYM